MLPAAKSFRSYAFAAIVVAAAIITGAVAIHAATTGNAVVGISSGANGVLGETSASPAPVGTAVFAVAGVLGQDTSSSGLNAGVAGTSSAPNGIGVAGQVDTGTGVYGKTLSGTSVQGKTTFGTGVSGVAAGGNGVYGATASNSFAAIVANNGGTTTGVGLQASAPGNVIIGTATTAIGNGVQGFTAAGIADMSGVAGVMGVDQGSAGGTFGVAGSSTNGLGVAGTSTNNYGVEGSSTNFVGVFGTASGNTGVLGTSTSGDGVKGSTHSGIGVRGVSDIANGVLAQSSATAAPSPSPGCCASIAALLVKNTAVNGAPLIIAQGNSGDVMSLDNSGNLILKGTSSPMGSPLVVHRSTLGRDVITYSGHQSVPSIEDFGEVQLVSGQAYVRLDPTFAAMLDPRVNYLVFITPLGDNRGLYVSQRSLHGFAVRESQGGRATLAFDYRIVAKPLDSNARRLPLIQPIARLPDMSPRPRALPRMNPPHLHIGYIPKLPRAPAIIQRKPLTSRGHQ